MNVIVVIIDSLRKDHVGAYGNDWIHTPNLDALAKDSLRFERAHPESIPTIPARRAIHTGIRSWPFQKWATPPGQSWVLFGWEPIPKDQMTLAEILQGQGYRTMLVTDTWHQFAPFFDFHRGFNLFEFIRGQEKDAYKPDWTVPDNALDNILFGGDKAWHMRDIMRQYIANTASNVIEEDWFSPQVFSRAGEYLEAASEGGQPFFMVVDNYDPHEPWHPHSEYLALYDDGYSGPEPRTSPNSDSGWLSEQQLKRMQALYSGETTMADKWLGGFLKKVDDLKLRDDTMVVLLSDHGFAFGEHGFAGKVPYALYPELTDIVFMVRHPKGKGAGKSSDYYASTHDVAPTILGSLGIEQPQPMEGADLTPLLDGKQPDQVREHFTIGYHDHVSARDGDYVMVSLGNGRDARLHDLRKDPHMQEDIASKHPEIVRRMYNDYVRQHASA